MPVGPSINPTWLGSVPHYIPNTGRCADRAAAGKAQDGGQDREWEAVPSAVERPSVMLDPQGGVSRASLVQLENPEKRDRLMFLAGLGPKTRGKGRGSEEMHRQAAEAVTG